MTRQREGGARSPWAALGVLAAALSMIVLDGTIVGVALPRIIEDLSLELTQAQWVTSVYAMVFAALLLASGRLGDRLGRRRMLLLGVVVFVVGSVLAGAADAATPLITARAVQGLGGALVLPATLSTVNATSRGADRATAFGIWGAVMAGMAAVGPLLGGWLTTSVDWRWIFYVNVPLGALVVLGTLLVVPETTGERGARGWDVDGLLSSGLALSLIVFGLIEGSRLGWWRPETSFSLLGWDWPQDAPVSVVPVALGLGLVMLALFLRWEVHRARVRRDALLDLTLFRLPTFSWGNVTATVVAAGEFALVFVLPLYLVNAAGLSIMRAGWLLAAMALGAFLSGASARHLAARRSPAWVVVLGLALELLGLLAVALAVWQGVAAWVLALPLVLYGVGLGLASAQLTSTVLRDVPAGQSGSASATQSTVRQVGSAVGTALAGTSLAVALDRLLPAALADLPGVSPQAADQVAAAVGSSAGGAIPALAAQAAAGAGPLAPAGGAAGQVLSHVFGQASAVAVLVAAGFLLLGLVGALQVARAAQGHDDGITLDDGLTLDGIDLDDGINRKVDVRRGPGPRPRT